MHTHPMAIAELFERDQSLRDAVEGHFGLHLHGSPEPLEVFLRSLDEAGVDLAVVLPLDCSVAAGCRIVSNEGVAELVADQPRLIGFASVDPNLPGAASSLKSAVQGLGLRGLKLDPSLQMFDIDDEEVAFPVYAACAELGVPMVMHCGLSWSPAGRAARAHPLQLESVVHAFPELRVVIAHCGFPWVDDALMLALTHPNVYLDTAIIYSGTPKDSVRRVLSDRIGLDVINRSLDHQLVFGSDHPRVGIKRMVAAVRSLSLPERIERRIMHENAAELLAL